MMLHFSSVTTLKNPTTLSNMDCLGNQPSLCGEKLTTLVTAEDINRMDKTKLVCVDRERRKKSHWLKYTATLWDFEEWKCH